MSEELYKSLKEKYGDKYEELAKKYKVEWETDADLPEVVKYLDEVSERDARRAASIAEFDKGLEDAKNNEKKMQEEMMSQVQQAAHSNAGGSSKSNKKDAVPELLECLKGYI